MPLVILRKLYPLAIFTSIYLIISGFYSWSSNNDEFIIYLALILTLIPITLTVYQKVKFPIIILWLLSLWGLLHMMGGIYLVPQTGEVLYNFWLSKPYLKYDQLIHAYGFGLCTWIIWFCLQSFQPKIKATAGPLSTALLAGLGLGAVNETIEFFASLLIEETNVGGYNNIGWDLVFNLIGGLIVIVLIRFDILPKKEF